MTFDEFIRVRYIDELARVFGTDGKVRLLFREARIPMAIMPQLDTPTEFWGDVSDLLFQGRVEDGMPKVLEAACRLYPGNLTFRAALRAFREALAPASHGTPAAAGDHQVFLAYSSSDAAAVESIARALVARGVKPWLDLWDLPAGSQVAEIGAVLDRIPAVAAFVGPPNAAGKSTGPWQSIEIGAALSRAASSGMPLIPVFLPGSPNVNAGPPLLRGFSSIRFERLDDERALGALVLGVARREGAA